MRAEPTLEICNLRSLTLEGIHLCSHLNELWLLKVLRGDRLQDGFNLTKDLILVEEATKSNQYSNQI